MKQSLIIYIRKVIDAKNMMKSSFEEAKSTNVWSLLLKSHYQLKLMPHAKHGNGKSEFDHLQGDIHYTPITQCINDMAESHLSCHQSGPLEILPVYQLIKSKLVTVLEYGVPRN